MNTHAISHHLNDETIWEYVRGKLSFGESLIVRTHIALCLECAESLAAFEQACGALMADVEDAPLANHAIDLAMARIELKEELPKIEKKSKIQAYGFDLPDTFSNVKINKRRFLGPNVWIAPITEQNRHDTSQTYLLWIKGGMNILPHTHTGREMTMVLSGGFMDGENAYNEGDFVECDEKISHAPIMYNDEDCLSLVYQDGPIKPQTILGHLLKPFARI